MSVRASIEERIQREGPLKTLDLEEVVIDGFPDALWDQPLEKLHLDNVAFLDSFPEEIFELKSLKELRLVSVAEHTDELDSDDYLESIPDTICQLSSLEYLDLCGNCLTELPIGLTQLENLTRVDLSENQLGATHSIHLPSGVKWLDVGNNQLTHLPSTILELNSLEDLLVGWNKFGELPRLPPSLQKLDASYIAFGRFPQELFQLKQLKELQLKSCGFNEFPRITENWESLNILNLSDNQLYSVSDDIGQLQELKSLQLKQNKIERVSGAIGQLGKLEFLDISDNKIQQFPMEMGQLNSLKSLNFSTNKVRQFPKWMYELINLETLQANWNNLAQLLPGVGSLKKLRYLTLYNAGIQFLPDDFKELTSLETCDIGINSFKKLPDFSDMSQLKFLGLSGLKNLDKPDEELARMREMPALSQLSLQNWHLQSLPDSLMSNPRLKRINIGRNEWTKAMKLELKERFRPITIWFSRLD